MTRSSKLFTPMYQPASADALDLECLIFVEGLPAQCLASPQEVLPLQEVVAVVGEGGGGEGATHQSIGHNTGVRSFGLRLPGANFAPIGTTQETGPW